MGSPSPQERKALVEQLPAAHLDVDIRPVLIDAAAAAALLAACNTDLRHKNRDLHSGKLTQYVRDMDSGNYEVSGDTIRFGADGVLYDGAHRLTAITRVQAMRTARGDDRPLSLPFIVIGNLPESVRKVIDIGAPRTFADAAVIADGTVYSSKIYPIGAWVMNWLPPHCNPLPGGRHRFSPTPAEFEAFYREHTSELNQAAYWGGYLKKIGAQPTAIGVAHYVIREASRAHEQRTNVDVPAQFFQSLATGAALKEGNPVLTLRETIRRRRDERNLRPAQTLALFLSAWNAYAEERMYYRAYLPLTVSNATIRFPVAPSPQWTGEVYRLSGS